MFSLTILPHTLLCLLQTALVFAQTRPQLSLNSLSSLSAANLTGAPSLGLPASSNLSVSVALCTGSLSSVPRFFLSNDTGVDINSLMNGAGGPGTQEIPIVDGYGSWTFSALDGAVLAVSGVGSGSFEVGVAENEPVHQVLDTLPFSGGYNFKPSTHFLSAVPAHIHVHAVVPNYTLPAANLSFPSPPPPSDAPTYSIVVLPTSSSPVTSIPQTACALRAVDSSASVTSMTYWARDSLGWRAEWLLGGLSPSTNYTAYVLVNNTKVTEPINLVTKSASFACPLVHDLPYCPSTAYAVPLPAPPFPFTAHDATTLPPSLTGPLLQYMTNFTTSLLTFPCGRDVYSPLQTCADCQAAYRKWLCAVQLPRCGEAPPSSNSTITSTSASTSTSPTPALLAQPTGGSGRNANMPAARQEYEQLLPCLETCHAVDRACPNFLGFKCPVVRFNAAMSYGVGYVDSGGDGVEGGGSTGVAQDRWGNVWCNSG